ncbi:hypothetical protein J6590_030107 [Homalodisca vitripennis]|nr:hypothetical protein J6590_030107 [Homalodisca vitripennis]
MNSQKCRAITSSPLQRNLMVQILPEQELPQAVVRYSNSNYFKATNSDYLMFKQHCILKLNIN